MARAELRGRDSEGDREAVVPIAVSLLLGINLTGEAAAVIIMLFPCSRSKNNKTLKNLFLIFIEQGRMWEQGYQRIIR